MDKHNDEIDLIELMQNMMLGTYHYFVRRFKMLAIFTAAGVVLGAGLYFKNKDRYENKISLVSNVGAPRVFVSAFNSLNEVRKSDKVKFRDIMKMSEEEAELLKGISADTADSRFDKKLVIQVSLKFDGNLDLNKFVDNLTDYAESNTYIAKRLKARRIKSESLIKKYNKEVKKLDSLQNKLLRFTDKTNEMLKLNGKSQGRVVLLDDKVSTFFHNDIIKFEKEMAAEKDTLSMLDKCCTVIDKSSGVKIKQTSFVDNCVKYGGIFLVVGFVITLLLEFKREAERLEKIRRNRQV